MDPLQKVLVTIYFIGIAAVVNVAPHNNVTKAVVFPMAAEGGWYNGIELTPHQTTLYVRGLENPDEDCPKINGTLDANGTVCSAPLKGAKAWVLPAEPLSEDAWARKIPSFLKYCPQARDLSSSYTGEPNEKLVALRFDIKGGRISGCNRNGQAYVTKMETATSDGVLYVQQAERTVRLALTTGAIIAIENKATAHHVDAKSNNPGAEHYGWYYLMNGTDYSYPINVPKDPVKGPPDCLYIPGADDNIVEGVGSAECGVTNYP